MNSINYFTLYVYYTVAMYDLKHTEKYCTMNAGVYIVIFVFEFVCKLFTRAYCLL